VNVNKWFKDYRSLLLVTLILAASSPVFTDILPNHHFSNWQKGILLSGTILLAVVAAKGEASRLATEKRVEIDTVEQGRAQDARYRELNQKANLLQCVSEELGEALSGARDALGELDVSNSQSDKLDARKGCIKSCLKGLCKVLESDKRPSEIEPLKVIYFKATLFELKANEQGGEELERRYWHYPTTIQPRTQRWDIVRDSNAAAVQAYIRRQEVILQNVKDAAAQGEVWKDSRPGQHKEYVQSSMLCVPIWGEQSSADILNPTVRGVITVDTNQLGYFGIGESERAFRAQVFGPFIDLIRLVYKLTD
jgi:hypothetical protein